MVFTALIGLPVLEVMCGEKVLNTRPTKTISNVVHHTTHILNTNVLRDFHNKYIKTFYFPGRRISQQDSIGHVTKKLNKIHAFIKKFKMRTYTGL